MKIITITKPVFLYKASTVDEDILGVFQEAEKLINFYNY
jgi:hypothetical protein